ncbi:hypothetical protein [Streptomyces sp. NBC_00151]|uniref:hypothetical protein n=1 Tax=Streptomyces sp. NBC_00151 TaxID=2975669 RepID=UPI002DDC284D|nr:hypothetical protein [Streptomyces sp. NBC_00151]WRZ36758.1 hypothetical protein OG915_00875 [Streptomyces sp. NBC_00151]WRZ44819.1 hypothetical protein OG915_46685 [Streptomyces sp. NBC_00151]
MRVLMEKQGWELYATFEAHFSLAANEAARKYENPSLATLTVSKPTWKRWVAGDQVPRGDAGLILEVMFGVSVDELLGPAPAREVVFPRKPHDASFAAARRLDTAFDSSFLSLVGAPPGAGGVWELMGLRLFDGTRVAIQVYEASMQDDVVMIGADDQPHMRTFTQAQRRALLLGSLGASGGQGLFVLDAAHARRRSAMPGDVLLIPATYRIDDLTFALLWAMLNLDDSLLADDWDLDAEQAGLEYFLTQRRSAVARAGMPELSNVGAAWLGSRFCTDYITRHLDWATESPLFWCREQFGEEASNWLFFRHKHRCLTTLARFGSAGVPSGQVFCIPETAVQTSEPYERVLVFLAIALMEMYGLNVWVCADPEYTQVHGFALVPQQRAVRADWLRTEAVWHVEVTDEPAEIRTYTNAVGHAQERSIMAGPTPSVRLRALAEYLGLDWRWLVQRCRELGCHGTEGMLRPRSRLLSADVIDRVLQFVGDLGPDGQPSGAGRWGALSDGG